jgi:hypothetical protein
VIQKRSNSKEIDLIKKEIDLDSIITTLKRTMLDTYDNTVKPPRA